MQSALCVILPVRLSVTNAVTILTWCWRTQCSIRPWCTQKIRPPVQIFTAKRLWKMPDLS